MQPTSSFHKKSLAVEMSFGAHIFDPLSFSGCFLLAAIKAAGRQSTCSVRMLRGQITCRPGPRVRSVG